jgi:predicted DsbA family dithiol-disulfide isomerase
MRIDIWSDVVCPWCYIGETRFERALAQYDGDVTIRRHPFALDPEAPIPGVPARERYAKKFGDEAGAILARVTSEAQAEGLRFNFDIAKTANTFDAHRALAFARTHGRERELQASLFAAYFTDGLDVSDRAVLAARGAAVGLDPAALAAYLESDAGVDEIRGEFVTAFERGITAVPSFVFNGEFLVPGAVDTDTFLRILEQMRDVA